MVYYRYNCKDCEKPCNGIRCRKCAGIFQRKYKEPGGAARNHHLLKKYGMDIEEFEAWWVVFRGKCGICEQSMTRPEKTRGQLMTCVSVDHDHKTGKVRGLLCSGCNKGIGMLKDNVEYLRKAIKWLGDGDGT